MLDRKTEVLEVYKEKARNLRYQKPMAKELNWWAISETLGDIMSDCADVRWMTEDEERLIDLLDGDEEQAFEFKVAFSALYADCMKMMEDMEEVRQYDFISGPNDDDDEATLFDCFFPAVHADGPYLGYDEYVCDYFPIDSFEADLGANIVRKRLKRMTKDQILDMSGLCLNIARSFVSIEYRYTSLKAAIDVLKGVNGGILTTIKSLEAAYQKWDEDSQGGKYCSLNESEFDKLLREMPDRLWVE